MNKVKAAAEIKKKGSGGRVWREWQKFISKDSNVGKRPTEAVGPVGYTVNAPRKGLASIKLPEMQRKDDKGHIIAARFNGEDKSRNLIPMARKVNQSPGKWYKAEAALAKAYKRRLAKQQEEGKKPVVGYVYLKLNYNDDNPGRRPNKLTFKWEIKDGSRVLDRDTSAMDNK